MLDSRNELTHTYSEEDSLEAINKIRTQYIPPFNLKAVKGLPSLAS